MKTFIVRVKDEKYKLAKLYLEVPDIETTSNMSFENGDWTLDIAKKEATKFGFKIENAGIVHGGPNDGYNAIYYVGPYNKIIKYAKDNEFEKEDIEIIN